MSLRKSILFFTRILLNIFKFAVMLLILLVTIFGYCLVDCSVRDVVGLPVVRPGVRPAVRLRATPNYELSRCCEHSNAQPMESVPRSHPE